jgi:tRNA (cmo5U34)-methyltransferase
MFSFETINDFDDHIASSIPNYDLLYDSVLSLSKFFVVPETNVIDLGCSTGKLLKEIEHSGQKIGIDKAENLLPRDEKKTRFLECPIEHFTDYGTSSLVLSIFTLQFMPRESRLDALCKIHDSLISKGAFIWAEKVYATSGVEQDLMNFAHYDFKRKNFTAEEILSKEEDLRSIMRLNTSDENERLAREAGFGKGIKFWKFFNFEATLYVK